MLWSILKRGHRRYHDQLSEYLDGRLDAAAQSRLEGHLESCPGCRHELDSLKATVGLLQMVPVMEPPRSFKLQAVPAPAPSPRRPLLVWSMQATTAVVAVLLAILLVGDYAGVIGDGATPLDEGLNPARQEARPEVSGAPSPAPTSEALQPSLSTDIEAPPPTPGPTPAPQPSQPSSLAPVDVAPVPDAESTATESATATAGEETGISEPARAGSEEAPAATAGALEEKAVEQVPATIPVEQAPPGPNEALNAEEGSVVTKIQIAVGAFLGVLAVATAYITLRRRRVTG